MALKEDSKYYPLQAYLRRVEAAHVTLSFDAIVRILGAPLPPSATRSRAFWSNRNRGGYQANAWLGAGFRVKAVDLDARQVRFERVKMKYVARQEGDTVRWDADMIWGLRTHLGVTQQAFGELLGVRQQTVSEWETAAYLPTRARSKYLSMIAESAGFQYEVKG